MPCDTPPPAPLLDVSEDAEDGDVDEMIYEIVDDYEILAPPPDDALVTFKDHTNSVFCCDLNGTGVLAVSGGQDDKAFVWETDHGTTMFECTGHSESVIAASFSPDSKYVATADMNGFIQVRDAYNGTQIWSFECAEITWMKWLHKQNVIVAGTTDGNCWKWSMPDGDTNMFPTSGLGSSAGCISSDDQNIAIGYTDGTLKVWSLSSHSVLGTVPGPAGHKFAITSIKYHPDNSLIVTGSEDGTAKLIRTSNYKVIWSINCCDAQHGHEDVSVEGIEFCPSQSLIILGSNCGQLSFWDISSQTKRFSCNQDSFFQSAIVEIICDEPSLMLYVGNAEGALQAYDIRTGHLKNSWDGHTSAILDFKLSKDRQYILTASEDTTCKIFTLPNS